MIDHKLFNLEFIDEQFKSLNLRLFDGDKLSPYIKVYTLSGSKTNPQMTGSVHALFAQCTSIAIRT